jgi:type IV pilus assembly protein PilY1
VQLECQRNATLLFTDGYANQWNGAGVGNADGGRGEPFEDDVSETMADIAMHYYDGDGVPLRADLPTGEVPIDQNCPDEREDCVSDLHMQTFGITLGALGEIFGQDMDATEDPFAHPPDWPTSFPNRHPSAVDDLWHATVNTRADMIDATNSTALAKAFRQIASQVRADVGSSAAVASNSTRLDTDTRIYQARFRSQRWSGELLAFDLDSDTGAIATTPEWNAAEQIPDPSNRSIYSYNPDADSGFAWPQSTLDTGLFSADQIDALNRDGTGTIDGRGEERLEWLRGNPIADFRDREVLPDGTVNLLGDIVNSDPVLVGDQDFGFRSLPNEEAADAYGPFIRDVKRERPEVVYVGANDGMLHAFNAETGEELFSFVPDGVYEKLPLLTDPEYEHRYYVDGSSRVLDAYIDHDGDGVEEWRTILLGVTGAGGRSVFALDVTDPENFSADDVLWEINDDTLQADTGNDYRLGATIGQPSIVRLAESERWAAVFGNGYGSATDRAELFVVDLLSGNVVRRIDTEVGDDNDPNGLSTGLTVDINGDRVTDRVYAGDLQGNMWRFDLESTNTGQWESAFSQGQTPEPLFIAKDDDGDRQPITARPIGARNPDDDIMIFFGSGKLFETGDNEVGADPRVESFYGIKDRDSQVGGRADLLEQTILAESDEPGGRFRITSDNGITSTDDGWYLDLVSPEDGRQGERVIEPAVLTSGDDIADTRVAFTTAIPERDPCSFGGSGWFMQLKAWDGSRPDGSIFDVNNDGVIDGDDLVDDQGVGGKSMDDIVTTPAIIKTGGGTEFNYMSGASGELYKEETASPAGDELGRQSWRQLR